MTSQKKSFDMIANSSKRLSSASCGSVKTFKEIDIKVNFFKYFYFSVIRVEC